MTDKVAVLIPTNSVKQYCVGKLIKNLRKMELEGGEIIFSDDSFNQGVGDLTDYSQFISSLGYNVVKVGTTMRELSMGKVLPIRERLCNAREALRDTFLKHEEFTHALWIDSDVLAPKDTVKRLLSHGKDVVSGVYYQHTSKKVGEVNIPTFEPVAYKFNDKETYEMFIETGAPFDNFASNISTEELNPSRLVPEDEDDIKITAVGLGCVMMSRAAMSAPWKFRYNTSTPGTEDMWMCLDLKSHGFKIYLDTYVRCRHHPKPWEGKV